MRRFWTRLLPCLILWLGSLGVDWPGARQKPATLPGRAAPAPQSKAASAPPRVESFRLRPGRGHPKTLMPGTIHSYTFNLKAGEALRLIFDQQGVDATIDVLDPSQKTILKVDSLNLARGSEEVPFIAETAGVYDVRVSSESQGRYSPRIVTRRIATPRDRTRAASVLAYFRGEEASRLHRPPPEIEKCYADAARLAGQVGETVHRADAYYKLGRLYCGDKTWRECRDSYLQAQALYEKNRNFVQEAALLTELADVFNILGEPKLAAGAFQHAIRLAQETKDIKKEATAWSNLGNLQYDQGEIEPALRSYERARDLHRQAGNTFGEVTAIDGCGRVYALLGRSPQALALYDQVQARLKVNRNDQLMAVTLLLIGDAYRFGGQLYLSISYYRRAIDLFQRLADPVQEATTLNNLGLTYYHLRQYRAALDAYLQAARGFHDSGRVAYEATAWSNVGWIQIVLDDVPQALKSFERALELGQKFNRRPDRAVAYFGMAWAERHRNNLIAAQGNVQKAIDILEDLRNEAGRPDLRMSLLGTWSTIYEFLVEILMEQHQLHPAEGHDVKAFEASEGARARSLFESLGKSSTPPLLSLAAVQSQVLDNDTVLLEYHLGDEKSFLWAVTQDSFASFELPNRGRIEPLAREVYRLLKKSHHSEALPEAARKARELAEILLGPVAGRLGKKRLLIVVPPSLQYVPFAALPDPNEKEPEGPAASWPTPLVYRHEIVSTPSASVLAALRAAIKQRRAARNLLAILADPVYERSDKRFNMSSSKRPGSSSTDILAGRFTRLKNSQEEADAISHIAGRQNVLDLRDFSANRDSVLDPRLRSYKYIHLSVHGDPDLPAIVLSAFDSQGRPRDPFLRAQDIQTLGLSADLVVLGSCGSGLGQEIRGEGIVGLTQAFLSAGASRIIVSLWNLNDLATSEIMPPFYLNLLKQGKTPSAALQQAQIAMWHQRRWNAPAYWAGLVQQGEWK
jgi:CHAT domain-containing protein/Tfp pilus assembly protein PilF